MSNVSWYGIGGRVRWLAMPRTVAELLRLLDWGRSIGSPFIVTGEGSNMLFSDEEFPGMVICTTAMNRMTRVSESLIFCEAGVRNDDICLRLLETGRSGGEWLRRLPGVIGATVRMNGRCYGREMSDVTIGVVTVGLDGTVRWRSKEEIFVGYKRTTLMDRPEIVAGVLLSFPMEGDRNSIENAMAAYEQDRLSKHQFDYPSCGSTFRNSREAGKPSGQIFESLGFKGMRDGGAQVSNRHANFIFNTGHATAAEVLRLAAAMRKAAREDAGASLELEVECAGSFDRKQLDACGVSWSGEGIRPGHGWAGLMSFPDAEKPFFPRMLLEGPMLDYSGRDEHFPPGVTVKVEQLRSVDEALQDPSALFLRWTTRDASADTFSLYPDLPAGTFTDRLWEYGVSELFIGRDGDTGPYLEFEVTPECHWIALRFDAPRKRAVGHERPSELFWQDDVKVFTGQEGFGMELSFRLVQPFILAGNLALQCCASLGNDRYGLFPWWHAEGSTDFHQPERFCPVKL